MYEGFEALLGIFIRIDLIISPLGLVFRDCYFEKKTVLILYVIFTSLEIFFLIDLVLRLIFNYRKTAKKASTMSKATQIVLMSMIPLLDLVVITSRLYPLCKDNSIN